MGAAVTGQCVRFIEGGGKVRTRWYTYIGG